MSCSFVENYERLSLKKTMNSFSSVTISFAVAFVLMSSRPTLGLSNEKKPCNVTTHYQLYNDTVNNVGCYPCPDCGPGFELPIPCGKLVHDSESISEHCRKCKPGTYSTKDDKLPCAKCHNSTCAQHEIVYCDASTGGNSRCTGNCEQVYVWNEKKTECELYVDPQTHSATTKKPDDTQTHSATTKKPDDTQTHNATTKKPDLKVIKVNHIGVPISTILTIIFGYVIGPLLAFIFACWCLIKIVRQKNMEVNQNLVNKSLPRRILQAESSSGSTEPLVAGTGQLIMQERSPLTSEDDANSPHLPETLANSAPVDLTNESNASDINSWSISMPSTQGDLIELETPVRSPAYVGPPPAGPVMPPEFLQARPPPTAPPPPEPPHYVPRNPDPMHFDNLPSELYTEICEAFDNGPPGKNSNTLADKLKIFSSKEARRLQGKADAIIQSWKSIRGNNVPKFVEVLNAMDMTDLADKLNDYMDQVRPAHVTTHQN